ncbi:MAG: radical SAM protein [Deltaproteobacteria bacterium]|nr:radical SAM protein [Deltaproteobacteria bacterium]
MSAKNKKDTRHTVAEALTDCRLCGHDCGVNRLAGEKGVCGAGARAQVSAELPHFGEEPPISGAKGSGTIFFSRCNLKCVFCQNHQISQQGNGRLVSDQELADIMIGLADQGAHNINLVSPTPWIPQILSALRLARVRGLTLPIVYNTGGYDSRTALGLLDGHIDIYLPDIKYMDNKTAERYSGGVSYPEFNQAAIREMVRQAGHLTLSPSGVAIQGVLVRHLVLPRNQAQTDQVLTWLAREFGPDIHVSLMAQYTPMHRAAGEADRFPELSRALTCREYEAAIDTALELDLQNAFIQELSASQTYVPDFESSNVFQDTDVPAGYRQRLWDC